LLYFWKFLFFYYNFYFHICVKTWRETTFYLYFRLPTSCTIKIYETILRRTVPDMLRNTGIWYMFVKANVFPDTGVAISFCNVPHII
jgi:hypothetical protein